MNNIIIYYEAKCGFFIYLFLKVRLSGTTDCSTMIMSHSFPLLPQSPDVKPLGARDRDTEGGYSDWSHCVPDHSHNKK